MNEYNIPRENYKLDYKLTQCNLCDNRCPAGDLRGIPCEPVTITYNKDEEDNVYNLKQDI